MDNDYEATVTRLRELALGNYGCRDFISVTEGENEITISYWNTLDDIEKWKNDDEHRIARDKGRNIWYADYRVEVVRIERRYNKPG